MSGFAFDPLAGEEASTLGRLTIFAARMNPGLAMGDELLTKTGSANLFMVRRARHRDQALYVRRSTKLRARLAP